MLDLTRVQGAPVISELALESTVVPNESGLCFIRVADALGNEVVKPSTGADSEVFAGLAYLDKHAATTGVRVAYPLLVPATSPYTVTLPDSIGIANLQFKYGGSIVDPGQYSVSGSAVTFLVAHAGHVELAEYNYTLSAAQQQALGISPIPSAAATLGKIALLQGSCRMFVTNFIASAAWAINADVTMAANGFLTVGGTTAVVGKCVHVPTAADPFLGISYTVI